MKTTTILLMVLAIGLLVTGCSKTTPTTPNVADTEQIVADATVADITIDTAATNPDIGTLDDTPVSDGLPQ